MLFKKKLNNVTKHKTYIKSNVFLQILAIPEIQETNYLNEVNTYIPKKKKENSLVSNIESNNRDRDDSTIDFIGKTGNLVGETEINQNQANLIEEEEESKFN